MMLDRRFQGLIMDLGVSEGNDTAYYLSKGFQVVAVEADPNACRLLRTRFETEIKSGALLLLNFAASDTFGDAIEFFAYDVHQGVSGVSKRPELMEDYTKQSVTTINWCTLRAQAGIPRYLKIDIEGQEEPFMSGLLQSGDIPEFMSVECYKVRPLEMMHEMGYARFKLVDQNPSGGFALPSKQFEGLRVESANFIHASGPFGLDIFIDDEWMDYESLRREWASRQPEMSHTWYDCHAWKPN